MSFLTGIAKSVRVYEMEGILESIELLTYEDTGRDYVVFTLTDGTQMNGPAPRTDENPRGYDYPVDIELGKPFAMRSFLVPAVDRSTGELVDSKRYVFPLDENYVDLEHTVTRDEYLATNYVGKPAGVESEVQL